MVSKGVIIGVIVLLVVLGFFLFGGSSEVVDSGNGDLRGGSEESEDFVSGWRDVVLRDVRTGVEFKVSDFSDKPILLESFAVWCPTCTKQQNEIKKFHEVSSDVISISLDTDPNEDEAFVLDHIERNGFDWYYAVSPVAVTQMLIDEFGPGIVQAPSVPMVLICGDKVEKLPGGVKDVDELSGFVASCG